jgi:hypothetical protein
MQANHVIDFDGGPDIDSPASRSLFYSSAFGRLVYFADTEERFRIQDDGLVLASEGFAAPTLGVARDAGMTFTNQTSGAGAAAGTLTNAPTAGNPGYWLKVSINGTTYKIPAWT